MPTVPYPVFTHRGDVRVKVDEIITELGMDPESAGLHKYIFVAQAHQTVVMVTNDEAPLAKVLRERKGWTSSAKL